MSKWCTSIVMQKPVSPGITNILNTLAEFDAANHDEAIGKAVKAAIQRNPGHTVHTFLAYELGVERPPAIEKTV